MVKMRRREYLSLAAASPLLLGGFAQTDDSGTSDGAGEGNSFTLLQGSQGYNVDPFQGDQTVEEFYQYRTDGQPHSHFEESREENSLLMLYRGPNGTSLIVSHDEQDHSSSGRSAGDVTGQFSGLPEDGSWVVKDDPADWRRNNSRDNIIWQWNDKHTDGGAFRGGLESARITISMQFEMGISNWYFLNPTPEGEEPVVVPLDRTQSVTLLGPETDRLWLLPDTENHLAPLTVLPNREGTVNLRVANGSQSTYDGLSFGATFGTGDALQPSGDTDGTTGSSTGGASSVPELAVTGTTPADDFSVASGESTDADVDIDVDNTSVSADLSASVSGGSLDSPVEERFGVTVADPLTVEPTVQTEQPFPPDSSFRVAFDVTANEKEAVREPVVSVDFGELPQGVRPVVDSLATEGDGGTWERDGQEVRWRIDRLAPGATFSPKLVFNVPQVADAGADTETELEDERLIAPSGDVSGLSGAYTLTTVATVPAKDGEGRTEVQEVETDVELSTKPLELSLETTDDRFAGGGGSAPVDVVVESISQNPVEVQDISIEVSGVPLTDPEADSGPGLSIENTSEDRFQNSSQDPYDNSSQDLFRYERGLDGTVSMEASIQPFEVTQNDPIEWGFEFRPPLSVDATGSHTVLARVVIEREEDTDVYTDTATLSIGDTAAFGRLAIEVSEQIDEIGDFASSEAEKDVIDELPRVAERVEEIVDAADDDDHPLTIEQAGDGLERLYHGERVVKETMRATRPQEPSFVDGAYGEETGESIDDFERNDFSLCFRTAKSTVKLVLIVGLIGKILSKLIRALKGAADDAAGAAGEVGESVAKFLADDIGGGAVQSSVVNIDTVAGGVGDAAGEAADTAVDKTGVVGDAAAATGDFVTDVGSAAADKAGQASDALVDNAQTVLNYIAEMMEKFLPGGDLLVSVAETVLGGAWDALGSLKNTFVGVLDDLADIAIETPGQIANLIGSGVGAVVEGAQRYLVWPIAIEFYKLVKNRSSLVLAAGKATSPIVYAIVSQTTSLEQQLTNLVDHYTPDSIADGLAGDHSAARNMGAAGVNWVQERSQLTVNAFENFSQGVTDIPDALQNYLDVLDQLQQLLGYIGDADWENALPAATELIDRGITYVNDVVGIVNGLTIGPAVNAAFGFWSTMELTIWSDFALQGILRGEEMSKTEAYKGVNRA